MREQYLELMEKSVVLELVGFMQNTTTMNGGIAVHNEALI